MKTEERNLPRRSRICATRISLLQFNKDYEYETCQSRYHRMQRREKLPRLSIYPATRKACLHLSPSYRARKAAAGYWYHRCRSPPRFRWPMQIECSRTCQRHGCGGEGLERCVLGRMTRWYVVRIFMNGVDCERLRGSTHSKNNGTVAKVSQQARPSRSALHLHLYLYKPTFSFLYSKPHHLHQHTRFLLPP